MITGIVTAENEAVVSLEVYRSDGSANRVEAVIDTGFNGFLTLPGDVISQLGLAVTSTVQVGLGDGREIDLYQCCGDVSWGGRRLSVDILETEGGSLIGMALLSGFRLEVDVVPGGHVSISPVR